MCGSWASNSWFKEEIALAKIDKRYTKILTKSFVKYSLEDLRNLLAHLKDVMRIDSMGNYDGKTPTNPRMAY